MKIKEVRELSTKEIEERIDAEIMSLEQKKINHSISPLENPQLIKAQRRTIARLKTELQLRIQNEK
jgi:large subunit ribosomal protein L29